MNTPIRRKIAGVWYFCYDIGCPDFKQAARNRERITNPPAQELAWWKWYEDKVQMTPRGGRLPLDPV